LLKSSLRSDVKRCFKCQRYGHFQADCPNKESLRIKDIENINHIHLETSEEKEAMEEQATVLALDAGEMLVLRRLLHTIEGP